MWQSFDPDRPYALTQEQIDDYRRDGHICVPQLATSDKITHYRGEIGRLVEQMNTEHRAIADRETYGRAFLQIFNLWRQSEVMRRFVLARRFGEVAARLMGVPAARIYHDQALFKEAGGGHTPWHQDQFYWPLDTNQTITMWMPLIDLTKDMGIMQFVSGSHRLGHLLDREISDASDIYFEDYIREHDLHIARLEAIKAGDATFHSGWTLHNAPPNTTTRMREVMTIIYFADGARVLEPDNSFRQNDLDAWLGGRQPGEVADSMMNPVV